MMPRVAALSLIGLVVLSARHGALAQRPPGPAPDRPGNQPADLVETLTVTGRGEVSADPDRAVVRLGVLAQEPQAAEAQQKVNQLMRQVLDSIRAAGVPREQIRTTGLSLSPVYQQQPPRHEPVEPRIVAYRASNSVEVQLTDLKRVGDVVDAAMAGGANRIEDIAFQLKDNRDAQRKALARAADDARAKAEAIASAMGLRLGAVLDVSEAGAAIPLPQRRSYAARGVAELAAATPVEPGQLQVHASLTVQYRLAQPRAPR